LIDFVQGVKSGAAHKRLIACGSMVLAILSVFLFLRLQSAKKETQKEDEVPLRTIISGLARSSCPIRDVAMNTAKERVS